MATIVAKALREAGVSIPLNQRVWQWVHDHKEQTSKEIGVALNEAQGNVSSVLGDMVLRKMMYVTKRQSAHKGGPVGYYSVNPKMKTFKLLPKTKPVVAAPVVVASIPEPTLAVQRPKFSLESLSVTEAYGLYKDLHVMFGPKAN